MPQSGPPPLPLIAAAPPREAGGALWAMGARSRRRRISLCRIIGAEDRLDRGEVRLVVEIGDERLHQPARLDFEAMRQDRQAVPIPRNKDQIVAALGQAIGIDRSDAGGRSRNERRAFGSVVFMKLLLGSVRMA